MAQIDLFAGPGLIVAGTGRSVSGPWWRRRWYGQRHGVIEVTSTS